MSELGYREGDQCNRYGCEGIVELEPVKDCSCHLSAPCWYHENADMHCPDCSWRAADDPLCVRDMGTIYMGGPLPYIETKPHVLDPSKIDYVCKLHSGCSMIKEGVYPQSDDDDADREKVRKAVDGTFGGRFERFGNGFFKFIAYTD